MITNLTIDNFKIYKSPTTLSNLNKINLLTGINGRGKSTTIQPLLLLKQALAKTDAPKTVPLNGDYVKLGNWTDVKNNTRRKKDIISFGYTNDGVKIDYKFTENERNNQILDLVNEQIGEEINETITDDTLKNLIFVSADRIGPRLQYKADSDIDNIRPDGTMIAQILANNGIDPIDENLLDWFDLAFPNSDVYDEVTTVMGMTEFWMSKMFGAVRLETSYVEDANIYTLKIKTRGGEYKPTNVGFGYAYALPIIVAGLTAPVGTILIVENPESHLHPSAQSVITKFLCMVAQQGVQVFIETHSEHVLNAARVLVFQEVMSADDVTILYFGDFKDQIYENIFIGEDGKLSNWPAGFFDQCENDLKLMLGF